MNNKENLPDTIEINGVQYRKIDLNFDYEIMRILAHLFSDNKKDSFKKAKAKRNKKR